MTSHQDTEERIRQRAHEIWQREGCPDGRSAEHWEAAREEISIEDNQLQATKPNPASDGAGQGGGAYAIEPVLAMENQGDMPGLTDQGEDRSYPEERDGSSSHVDVGELGERTQSPGQQRR